MWSGLIHFMTDIGSFYFLKAGVDVGKYLRFEICHEITVTCMFVNLKSIIRNYEYGHASVSTGCLPLTYNTE